MEDWQKSVEELLAEDERESRKADREHAARVKEYSGRRKQETDSAALSGRRTLPAEETGTGTARRRTAPAENTGTGTARRRTAPAENRGTGTAGRRTAFAENRGTGTAGRRAASAENTGKGTARRRTAPSEGTARRRTAPSEGTARRRTAPSEDTGRRRANAGRRKQTASRGAMDDLREIPEALRARWEAFPADDEGISSWFVFPATLFYNELFLKIFGGTGVFRHFFYMLLFALGVGLFYAALTSAFSRRTNSILTKILLIVNAVLFSMECIIQSVYQTYMSLQNLVSGAGNVTAKYSGEVVRSVIFGLPKVFVFALPVVLYFLFARRYLNTQRREITQILCAAIAGLVIFGFTSLGAAGGKNAAIYGAQFDFNRATETFGLCDSTRLSFKYRIFGNKNSSFHAVDGEEAEEESSAEESAVLSVTPTPTPAAKTKNEMALDFSGCTGSEEITSLNQYVQSLSSAKVNEYTGLFEGKNLIMVCAESYCGNFIREDLTPTLWRLTHNGFEFEEYYQPEWGGSTTTGEVAYFMGLASRLGDESMINTKENNNYFTLPNQFQRLGYSTCGFHNGAVDYYDRDQTHPNLGLNQFIANENGIDELCGTIYPDDTDLITDTIGLYLDKQPFCIYYMTLSGHAPYEADNHLVSKYYDRVNEVVGDEYAETSKYYICYQMELESAMTALVEGLEKAGIADDTVIVMIGDHYPYGLGLGEAWGNDADYIEDILGHSDDCAYEEDENTLVIWSGCLENEDQDKAVTITEPVFCLDILPTLSNLFGLDYDSRLLPGRDVFSDAEPICFWNNLSWVTDKGKYDSYTDTFHPRDGVEVEDGYVDRIHQIVQNKILMSRVIMDNDYYGLLFGPDTVTSSGQVIYVPGQTASSASSAQDGGNTDPAGNSETTEQTESTGSTEAGENKENNGTENQTEGTGSTENTETTESGGGKLVIRP